MLLGNTGVFQPRDRGHHAWWLKIFPLFRNFYAELSIFRTGCPLVVTSIWPCSPSSECYCVALESIQLTVT